MLSKNRPVIKGLDCGIADYCRQRTIVRRVCHVYRYLFFSHILYRYGNRLLFAPKGGYFVQTYLHQVRDQPREPTGQGTVTWRWPLAPPAAPGPGHRSNPPRRSSADLLANTSPSPGYASPAIAGRADRHRPRSPAAVAGAAGIEQLTRLARTRRPTCTRCAISRGKEQGRARPPRGGHRRRRHLQEHRSPTNPTAGTGIPWPIP
jgi:hypothetical protein